MLSNLLGVAAQMRMTHRGHLVIRIIRLGTPIAFARSGSLNFATLLRMNSLVLLLSNSSSDAAIDSTDGSNRKIVVLLRRQIVLIQNKFTLFVQLLIERFIVQIHIDM